MTIRKPIAQFFLGSGSKVAPDNRHGLTVPLESPGFLAWLDGAIANAVECCRIADARGVTIWDGAGYSRGAYLAPDMIPDDLLPFIDYTVASFRVAGVRVGFTLRPPSDATATIDDLARQAAWAQARWGGPDRVSFFYVDSDWGLRDKPAEWGRLSKLCRKTVFVSEMILPRNASDGVWSYVQEEPGDWDFRVRVYWKGWLGTHPAIRAANRKAWSVIDLPYSGVPTRDQNPALFDHLVEQVRQGDSMYIKNTWWTTADAKNVRAVYDAASKRRAA